MRLPFHLWSVAPREKILVADDEPHLVRLISSWLRRAGYTAVSTTRVANVLSKAKSEAVDLIILDIHWPRAYLRGCDVAKELRAEASLASVPLILLGNKSAGGPEARGAELLGHGRVRWRMDLPADAASYLFKPFSQWKLLALVEELLHR